MYTVVYILKVGIIFFTSFTSIRTITLTLPLVCACESLGIDHGHMKSCLEFRSPIKTFFYEWSLRSAGLASTVLTPKKEVCATFQHSTLKIYRWCFVSPKYVVWKQRMTFVHFHNISIYSSEYVAWLFRPFFAFSILSMGIDYVAHRRSTRHFHCTCLVCFLNCK